MLFNSLVFPTFLVFVLTVHWWLRGALARRAWLLAASNVFYGWWDYRFLALMWLSSGVDYLCGLALDREASPSARRRVLAVSLATNLAVLGTFKYLGFFAESVRAGLRAIGIEADWPTLHLVLPVGISFYTFQSMSYALDVYLRRIPACRDPLAFFLFVAYFPQLVAGPIERAGDLMRQLDGRRPFDEAQARWGLRCMLWGFFLKCVVADNMAAVANEAYTDVPARSGADLLLGTYAFALQIYGDFGGYSLIAIGTSALFGVGLSHNFRSPYLSESVREFWTRWHVSLTSWFRDYVYIVALGGSRVSAPRRIVNVLATFTLSGLWHGANWTFVAWGTLNGLLYFVPRLFTGAHPVARAVNALVAFHLVCLGWIFFRAADLTQALHIVARILSPSVWEPVALSAWTPALGILPALVLAAELGQRHRRDIADLEMWPRSYRRALYGLMCGAVFFAGIFERTPFIYFQF